MDTFNEMLLKSNIKYISYIFIIALIAPIIHIVYSFHKLISEIDIIIKWISITLIYILIALMTLAIKAFIGEDLYISYSYGTFIIIILVIVTCNYIVLKITYNMENMSSTQYATNITIMIIAIIIMFAFKGLINNQFNIDHKWTNRFYKQYYNKTIEEAIRNNNGKICFRINNVYYTNNYSKRYYHNYKYYDQKIVDINACILIALSIESGNTLDCFTTNHNVNELHRIGRKGIEEYYATKQCLQQLAVYDKEKQVLKIDEFRGDYQDIYDKYVEKQGKLGQTIDKPRF